jgi:hypothetical protein
LSCCKHVVHLSAPSVAAAIGVPPGTYEVAWVVDVTNSYLDNVTVTLSAEAVPLHAKQQQQQQQQGTAAEAAAVIAAGLSAAAGAASSSAVTGAAATAVDEVAGAAASLHNKVEVQQCWEPDLRRLQLLCRSRGSDWGIVSGGLLHLTDYSTVQLRFSATDNTYKQNMRWAMAELIPVKPQQQQQQRQGAAAQHNRVWHPPARQGHRLQRDGTSGAACGDGVAADSRYAQGIMGWLERMFGPRFE